MLFLYFQDPLAFYFMESSITQAYLDLFQEMYYQGSRRASLWGGLE